MRIDLQVGVPVTLPNNLGGYTLTLLEVKHVKKLHVKRHFTVAETVPDITLKVEMKGQAAKKLCSKNAQISSWKNCSIVTISIASDVASNRANLTFHLNRKAREKQVA